MPQKSNFSDTAKLNVNAKIKSREKNIKRSANRAMIVSVSTCERRECKTLTEREKARFMLYE